VPNCSLKRTAACRLLCYHAVRGSGRLAQALCRFFTHSLISEAQWRTVHSQIAASVSISPTRPGQCEAQRAFSSARNMRAACRITRTAICKCCASTTRTTKPPRAQRVGATQPLHLAFSTRMRAHMRSSCKRPALSMSCQRHNYSLKRTAAGRLR